jgi:hypothetical protein
VQAGLKKHRRFVPYFHTHQSSWLNLVERWFADVDAKALRRGIFLSVSDLQEAIQSFLAAWNTDPKPIVWTAKLEDILEKMHKHEPNLNRLSPVLPFLVAVKNARNEYAQLFRGHYTSSAGSSCDQCAIATC